MDIVVGDLISSLSEDKTRVLGKLVLNHQIEESRPWYDLVISYYFQNADAADFIREIDELLPNESALKFSETSSEMPVFEAKVILREAQKILQSL
ncbi:hypothetical protein [Paraherbaspirillum soli]|uniref:CdiI immunity protein domain-containing protein n=1 Tax=Paraherbaspirillum soli TaxID=631222 RepID=A0ABW0MCN1_9BURK